MTRVLTHPSEGITIQKPQKLTSCTRVCTNNLVILESLLVGYHDPHFRMNYALFTYEPVYR